MSIKTIIVQPGGGFDHVVVGSTEPRQAGPGEVTVRLHASSLNYHDYAVVSGAWGGPHCAAHPDVGRRRRGHGGGRGRHRSQGR